MNLGPRPARASRASDRDPATSDGATVVFSSPNAVRRILWMPNELGLARGYVAGEIGVEGDIYSLFRLQALLSPADRPSGWRARLEGGRLLLAAARATGALGPPLQPPAEEARLRGARHSRARDAQAIAHHYDVSNDFYRLFLGETMTYSCAYFATPETPLADAQRAKYDLICRKLGLRPGMRLLDVGCGWGGMPMHAAEHYGVQAVGVTLSRRQVEYARDAVAAAGLGDRVDIRLQDYRDVADGPFDAVSSIGMFEHVGASRLGEYFGRLHALLRPGGRLLNHGICRPRGSRGLSRTSFAGRYVFPDGELHEVGIVAQAMQGRGFEVRDTQSLREHYALTLRHWVRNLEDALGRSGPPRRRRASAGVAPLHGRLGGELRPRQDHRASGAGGATARGRRLRHAAHPRGPARLTLLLGWSLTSLACGAAPARAPRRRGAAEGCVRRGVRRP